jgi:hypothetical protein
MNNTNKNTDTFVYRIKRNKKNSQKVISKEGLDTGVFVLPIVIGLDTIYKCVRIFIGVIHNNIFLKSYFSGITVIGRTNTPVSNPSFDMTF